MSPSSGLARLARRLLAGCWRGAEAWSCSKAAGFDHDAASADLNRGEVVGQPYHPLEHSRLRFFGGTTAIWGGRCAEFDPIDFERRDWIPHSGWPFGADDIHSYLAEARTLLGVDVVDPGRLPHPPLMQRLSSEELAVRWWSFDPKFDRFTIDQASDLEQDPRCTLLVKATVRELMLSSDKGSVERLDVRTPSGRTIDVRARHYIGCGRDRESPHSARSNSVATASATIMTGGRPLLHGASPCPRRARRRPGRLAVAVGLRQAAGQRR